MKNKMPYIALAMLIVSLIACHRSGRDTSITINDSKDIYRLTAYFPEEKTEKLKRYITNCISSQGEFFPPNNDAVDINAEMKDNTRFHIKAERGKLRIEFKKSVNSDSSFERMRKMGEGIKKILAES